MRRDRGLIATGVLAVVLIGGAIALLIALADQGVPTRGPSMRPSLGINQPIDIDTEAYEDDAPERGDVVALQAPQAIAYGCEVDHPKGSPCPQTTGSYVRTYLVKRAIALGGDEIAFRPDGVAILNGEPLNEPYVRRCPGTCALPTPITVPAGYVFVAGDNRPKSSDSRIWGAVPVDAIDGRATLRGG